MNLKINNTLSATDIYLTPSQAAQILNISIATLKKSIYQGKIRTFKTVGGHHRIRRSDLFVYPKGYALDEQESFDFPSQNTTDIIEGFVKIYENKFRFCVGHASNVAFISEKIGQALGLTPMQRGKLKHAALLHDCGKFFIDEGVVNKLGQLSASEYEIVKTHVELGSQYILSIKPLADLAVIIGQHHERYDGTGYPCRLSGQQILIEARIIAVADAFSVMTAIDSYRPRGSIKETLLELNDKGGTQFDPNIVKLFVDQCARNNNFFSQHILNTAAIYGK
jgi:excisionase family DNA binding protein